MNINELNHTICAIYMWTSASAGPIVKLVFIAVIIIYGDRLVIFELESNQFEGATPGSAISENCKIPNDLENVDVINEYNPQLITLVMAVIRFKRVVSECVYHSSIFFGRPLLSILAKIMQQCGQGSILLGEHSMLPGGLRRRSMLEVMAWY